MQTPLQIAVRNVEDSETARALVRKCVDKLEVFYDRITSCDGTADVAYATAMATIEAARLDPATTDKEIRQLTARVHRINVKSVS